MSTQSDPRGVEIAGALREAGGQWLGPWRGDCWRFQTIGHPRAQDILNGLGAFAHGGRWNAPRTFPVVYGSADGMTALKESEANDRYYRVVSRKARIYVCIEFRLQRVLDLSDPSVLGGLKINAQDLWAEDWRKLQARGVESLSQCIGRAAHAAGAEAILVGSAAVRGGLNLAFFPRNQDADSRVILHDEAAIQALVRPEEL